MANIEHEMLRSLLQCLADEGTNAGLPAVDRFYDDHLILVARAHRLSALLGALRPKGIPVNLAERFRRDHVATLARNLLLRRTLVDCLRVLGDCGIETIVLKGMEYEERLYGRIGARPTSDLDVLIPEQHRRAAFQALRAAGWSPVAAAPGFDEADYHEVEWKRAGVFLDLHFALAPLPRCGIDYQAVWRDKVPLVVEGQAAFRLSDAHDAVYHVLHMAIHHFDVPGVYLVDLTRMIATDAQRVAAEEVASQWRCFRPWRTSLLLTAAFLPWWPAAATVQRFQPDSVAARVIDHFGTVTGVSRVEQLRRKLEHFDATPDAARYLLVQGRRIVREAALRWFSRRPPEERLGFPKP
ncbi:MAG: hypothetical protein QOI66_3990 [Myxococcales bacterium]|nr:hypothetical protein [Myxococcales bacterium]